MENRLRILRAERRWPQADLAKELRISRQSINAIETGKYDPSLPLDFKLARVFDTPFETIFLDSYETDSYETDSSEAALD